MKKVFLALSIIVGSFVAKAELTKDKFITFDGVAAIEQVKLGNVKSSIRLSDRSASPYFFKVGNILPIVNSNVKEDTRSVDAQVTAEAYKYVKFTSMQVTTFTALTPAQQTEVKSFYSQEKIDAAKGVVTLLGFEYQARK